jgi:hypothetical protein
MALVDWIEALSSYPAAALDHACRVYLREQRRRPTPADIVNLARAWVREGQEVERVALPPPPEPEKQRVTPEMAARIMAEAGFRPDAFGLVALTKRMPKGDPE